MTEEPNSKEIKISKDVISISSGIEVNLELAIAQKWHEDKKRLVNRPKLNSTFSGPLDITSIFFLTLWE